MILRHQILKTATKRNQSKVNQKDNEIKQVMPGKGKKKQANSMAKIISQSESYFIDIPVVLISTSC